MVKKIQCKVIRSVPLGHKTCEQNQQKRTESQFDLGNIVRGLEVQPKPYEQNADNRAHFNDRMRTDLYESFGCYIFTQGQLLNVWA